MPADNGAAEQSGRDTRGNPAVARFGNLRRCHGRNSQRGDGSERHQCLLHGFTFLLEAGQCEVCPAQKFHTSVECSMNGAHDFGEEPWPGVPFFLRARAGATAPFDPS